MKSRNRIAGGIGLLLVLAAGCAQREADLEFTIAFQEEVDVDRGTPVTYKGVRIGEVRSVDLDSGGAVAVRVRIDAEQARRVYREADFRIESFKDGDRERLRIAVEDRDAAERTPIAAGDIIAAAEEDWRDRGRRALQEGAGKTRETLDRLWAKGRESFEGLKEYAQSDEAKELRESIDRFFEDTAKQGEDAWRSFREETYPEIRRKAEDYKAWLEEQGFVEDAKRFWADFLEWIEEMLQQSDASGKKTADI